MKAAIDTQFPTAEIIRAETAMESFRYAGYNLHDAVGEAVDNSIQAGAKRIRIDWLEVEDHDGKNKHRQISALAIGDDGAGIPPNILANVLTIGFSTRYGDRSGIGRFGVGFKLASLSQARRVEVYTKPAYLEARPNEDDQGDVTWSYGAKNQAGRVFKTYFDLDEIKNGQQAHYVCEEVGGFPPDFEHLMSANGNGTLVVWQKTDLLNREQAYTDKIDEKILSLHQFLSRAYRVYLDSGLDLFIGKDPSPIDLNDPTFLRDNPFANALAKGEDMQGEIIDEGDFTIDGHKVKWIVALTPRVTRLASGGGGIEGPDGKQQFKKLRIPDNESKISFLRHDREISYTFVPWTMPQGRDVIDRYIGVEVSFPPALDEYFQVKHVKRGVEPVDKLKARLRKDLEKPILLGRKKIRALWGETKKQNKGAHDDVGGGRAESEKTAKEANSGMPVGLGGASVSDQEEQDRLRVAAVQSGISNTEQQEEFVKHAQQNPLVAIEVEWPGKGLIDIEHLHNTVLVKINKGHPFIRKIYLPLKEAVDAASNDDATLTTLLKNAVDGIDLLLFAYAKAENMSQNPEEDYGELREDWGKFTAVYLNTRERHQE